jgi:hypothetical protein
MSYGHRQFFGTLAAFTLIIAAAGRSARFAPFSHRNTIMKSFLYTLVAVSAISLGGAFSSSAFAQHGHGGHHGHSGHQGHGHSHHSYGHSHYYPSHSHHNHGYGHQHYHGGYGYGYGGGYYRPVYPSYYQSNGIYFRGSNFGVRIGF